MIRLVRAVKASDILKIIFISAYISKATMGNCSSMVRLEESADFLTENVYRIINTAYYFDLPGYTKELKDDDRYKELRKFEHSFSFIKEKSGYLIKNLRDGNCLYASDSESNIEFRNYDGTDSLHFLWEISFTNALICKIFSLAKNGFLVINKYEDKVGDKGQISIFYNVQVGNEKIEKDISGLEFYNSEWRLNPFYPSEGYSDFFKIIEDCGELIALKYNTKLKSIKTVPISSHDHDCLSVACKDKTKIFLNTNSPHYKPNMREIFSTEDVFKSTSPPESSGSVVKVTRVIETEEIVQTTIENSLITLQKRATRLNEANLQRSASEKGAETVKMDQTSFSQSLNTLLSVAVTKAMERSTAVGNRQSKTISESEQKSNYQDQGSSNFIGATEDKGNTLFIGHVNDTGSSNSRGAVKTKSVGGSVSAHASVNAPFVSAGVSASIHADLTDQDSSNATSTKNAQTSFNNTTNQNIHKSSNTTKNTNRGKSFSTNKQHEETREHHEETINRTSHSEDRQRQRGTLKEEREEHADTNTRRVVDAKEFIKEQEKTTELGIEQSLDLTQIESVTKKKNEKWFIEREFMHLPNTALKISFFEETIEAINQPFEVSLHISGKIGFTFKDNIFINTHRHLDYLSGSTWFLSPATIFNYLKAPGYKLNEDGSVDYIVKGKLSLKRPLNIFTLINQEKLPCKSELPFLSISSLPVEEDQVDEQMFNTTKKRKTDKYYLSKI